MDFYQQFPYQPLPQQPEIDYRQQGFPGGGGGFFQQINRLERQIERIDRRIDQLDRRVDRIERRLGLRQEGY